MCAGWCAHACARVRLSVRTCVHVCAPAYLLCFVFVCLFVFVCFMPVFKPPQCQTGKAYLSCIRNRNHRIGSFLRNAQTVSEGPFIWYQLVFALRKHPLLNQEGCLTDITVTVTVRVAARLTYVSYFDFLFDISVRSTLRWGWGENLFV